MLLSFFFDNINFCEEANKNDDYYANINNNINKEWSYYFFNRIFSQYFRNSADLLQKSAGSVVRRVRNEGSVEIGNIFC